MGLENAFSILVKTLILSVFVIGIFGVLYNIFVPESAKPFGILFIFIPILMITFVVFNYIRRGDISPAKLNRTDWMIFIIAVLLLGFIAYFLPQLVPEAFSTAVRETASSIGMGGIS